MFQPYLDKFVMAFVNGILIYSKSEEEYEEHLRITLQTLKDNQLYAKFSKCKFWLLEVMLLIHVVYAKGTTVNPSKIEAITDLEQLKTVLEIRSFFGLAGYYRRFIQDFSKIAALVTQLTQKGVMFVWTDNCEEAF